MSPFSVFELRQYTLRPGLRDTLIELFDREFVETQEAAGMWIVGQFRDLDRADRFVWVRGFADMVTRKTALTDFYGGPVWKQHRAAANATMVDSDDVLLLRPAYDGSGFAVPEADERGLPSGSIVTATVLYRATPIDAGFVSFFADRTGPALEAAGARQIALLRTEPAENTFPVLPVRTGEHVLVAFAGFAGLDEQEAFLRRLDGSRPWSDLRSRLARPPQWLRLAPTTRSQLR